jgi:hypothetical protein
MAMIYITCPDYHQTGPFQDGHGKIKHTYVAGVIEYDDIPV